MNAPFSALFISNDSSVFDTQSATRARMRAYAKEIGTLHILSHAPVGSTDQQEDIGEGHTLFLHPLKGRKPFSFIKMKAYAHALILTNNIQVVSAQDPFEYGWVASGAVKGTNAKLHVQIHTDFLSPWFTRGNILRSTRVHMPFINRIRQRIADRVLPLANGIRTVSKRVQDSVITRYGTHIPYPSVIPIAIPSDLPPAVPLPEHVFTFILISVSRLEPEKRIEDVLAALARIHSHYPSVGLFIVGSGSERRKLQKYVHALGLGNNVLFLGNRDDALGLMQSAHAFIQASAYEGYGRTLLEAALARLPIITTDVGIVGEVFRGYEDVLAAPPGDPAALATHIMGLVEDNEARKQFSINAEHAARTYLASVQTAPNAIAADLRSVLS